MAPQIYFVGTDTELGKTHVVAALCRNARARVLPYKPAQSGSPGEPTDAARLHHAAAHHFPNLHEHEICPLSYPVPLAPGMAHARDPAPISGSPLAHVREHLAATLARHQPDAVFVEGAGGLLVPMPGDTWQPEWIAALAQAAVVIARPDLGTINHTLLTIDALRSAHIRVLGFIFNDAMGEGSPERDPSRTRNAMAIAQARNVPLLGSFAHGHPRPEAAAEAAEAIISRCKTG